MHLCYLFLLQLWFRIFSHWRRIWDMPYNGNLLFMLISGQIYKHLSAQLYFFTFCVRYVTVVMQILDYHLQLMLTYFFLHLIFQLFQPKYSYVDGDGTVPSESAKAQHILPWILLTSLVPKSPFDQSRTHLSPWCRPIILMQSKEWEWVQVTGDYCAMRKCFSSLKTG